jgi:hypothetical protein
VPVKTVLPLLEVAAITNTQGEVTKADSVLVERPLAGRIALHETKDEPVEFGVRQEVTCPAYGVASVPHHVFEAKNTPVPLRRSIKVANRQGDVLDARQTHPVLSHWPGPLSTRILGRRGRARDPDVPAPSGRCTR